MQAIVLIRGPRGGSRTSAGATRNGANKVRVAPWWLERAYAVRRAHNDTKHAKRRGGCTYMV